MSTEHLPGEGLIPTSRIIHEAWSRDATPEDYSTIPLVGMAIDIVRCQRSIHAWMMGQLAANPGKSMVEILAEDSGLPSAHHTVVMLRQLQIDVAFVQALPGNPAAPLVDPLPGALVTRMAAAWVDVQSALEHSRDQGARGEIPSGRPVRIPEMNALEELSAAYDNMITDLIEGRRRLKAPEGGSDA